jgi:hypothetical protein
MLKQRGDLHMTDLLKLLAPFVSELWREQGGAMVNFVARGSNDGVIEGRYTPFLCLVKKIVRVHCPAGEEDVATPVEVTFTDAQGNVLGHVVIDKTGRAEWK